MKGPQTELTKLASRVGLLRQRLEQLSALRDEERRAPARIASLERVLDFDRVAAHVGDAVARSEWVAGPVPHLIVSNLLPGEVYRALVDAIPHPVFFDGHGAHGQELRVPPRLAPSSSIVAWTFMHDVVLQRLADRLVARVTEAVGPLTVSRARLLRRTPGYGGGGGAADRPPDLLTGIVDLARNGDTEEYGNRLQAAAMPFRANTLLVCVGPPEARAYAPIPSDAPVDTERYSYEFGIGSGKDARRASTTPTGKAT